MKYPTSFRGWKALMETPPGMDRVREAVRRREEAESNFNMADRAHQDVAALELAAAEERVRVEIRGAKHEK